MLTLKEVMQRFDARLARHGKLGAVLVKGVLGTTSLKLAFSFLGFLVAMVLAKSLGPSGYGTYSFVMALVGFLTIPSELGIPNLAVREIAIANAKQDWSRMRGFTIWAHRVTAILSLALIAAGGAGLLIWGDRLEPHKLTCMWLALLLVPLISVGALRGAMLRGLRKVLLGQLPEQVIRPAALLVLMLFMLYFGPGLDSPDDAMYAQVGAVTIAFLWGVYLFFRHRPPGMARATPSFEAVAWLQSSIPFGMTAAMQLINGRTDILALGMFRDHAEVGSYRVAVQIAALVIFGQKTVNAIQGPHVAHLYAEGDMKKLQKMITKSSQAVFLFALASIVFILVFGKPFIRIAFGPEFTAAYLPLLILCTGQLVNAAMGSVASLLNMTGHERDTTKSVFVAAAINLVLNFTMTPIWGANGAAIATATTLITWNLVMRHKVLKNLGIETSPIFRLGSGRRR